ncbi:hypothetical protein L2E82_27352 [Cichorium intybus]|uniref:Uncharacterized protein n=1 Tax=Cichorium intybus TaxID=13427 RepID=A0ACB9CSP9_CICIN|nr:hypothetical protein L2E82_27352 [Cichorium intybus]
MKASHGTIELNKNIKWHQIKVTSNGVAESGLSKTSGRNASDVRDDFDICKDDFDQCGICLNETGHDTADYIRMDHSQTASHKRSLLNAYIPYPNAQKSIGKRVKKIEMI